MIDFFAILWQLFHNQFNYWNIYFMFNPIIMGWVYYVALNNCIEYETAVME